MFWRFTDSGLSPCWALCGLVRDGDSKVETTGEIDGGPWAVNSITLSPDLPLATLIPSTVGSGN